MKRALGPSSQDLDWTGDTHVGPLAQLPPWYQFLHVFAQCLSSVRDICATAIVLHYFQSIAFARQGWKRSLNYNFFWLWAFREFVGSTPNSECETTQHLWLSKRHTTFLLGSMVLPLQCLLLYGILSFNSLYYFLRESASSGDTPDSCFPPWKCYRGTTSMVHGTSDSPPWTRFKALRNKHMLFHGFPQTLDWSPDVCQYFLILKILLWKLNKDGNSEIQNCIFLEGEKEKSLCKLL